MAESRVFVITGASSGIGAATAVEASRQGYRLVLASRREDALEEVASRCEGETLTVPVDVTSWEENERLAEAAALGEIGGGKRRDRLGHDRIINAATDGWRVRESGVACSGPSWGVASMERRVNFRVLRRR